MPTGQLKFSPIAQAGRAGPKKTILATEDTEAGGTRNPKGHGNLLCNMGIISWNKNKKLKQCNTEDTEFLKKFFLCDKKYFSGK
jgi:hypothetical protein